jgi:SAM-dependent methyltransferase
VIDLGCGLGASLLWLREHVPFEGIGITVSGVQARATQAAFMGVEGLRCLEASYTDLPAEMIDVDVAFAIESFVHAPSAEAFLAPIARALRPGGELLICDDFLGSEHPHHAETLDKTRWGWLANCLVSPDDVIALAAKYGLDCAANDDLTEFLELGRPRDRLLELAVALGAPFKPSSWLFRSWVGGVALQKCLKKRALEYRLLRFVKRAA